ncbi:hypothetical protein IFM89_026493 [Coptis chinensis]|uniref:Cytochrome P450 n=1 Tax=Coptis chinensis TaxID=261450 RepID=A0A835IFV4_9MAGN|nr:hypothetical protein IFM89_026493 [Coptis chinensis]
MTSTLSIHHDREVRGEDVEEFKPERFSEGIAKASKDHVAFLPFGWGPRICLGQNFAMMEAKMALAMILQHISLSFHPHMPMSLHYYHSSTSTWSSSYSTCAIRCHLRVEIALL